MLKSFLPFKERYYNQKQNSVGSSQKNIIVKSIKTVTLVGLKISILTIKTWLFLQLKVCCKQLLWLNLQIRIFHWTIHTMWVVGEREYFYEAVLHCLAFTSPSLHKPSPYFLQGFWSSLFETFKGDWYSMAPSVNHFIIVIKVPETLNRKISYRNQTWLYLS